MCEVGHSMANHSTVLGNGNSKYSLCIFESSLDLRSPIVVSDLVSRPYLRGVRLAKLGILIPLC